MRLVDRAVEIALREGLGGAAEDRDLAHAVLERAIEAALVRDEHRVAHAVAQGQPAEQVFGVGELRHPLRVHEAGGFDDLQAGVAEAVDELGLDLDRDDRRFVLQPVARSDLVDR